MTEADLGVLRKRERGIYFTLAFISGFMLLLCLLIIPFNDGWEVAAYVSAAMAVILIIILVLFYKLLRKTRHDRQEMVKVCGNFVVNKVIDQGEYSTQWYLTVQTEQKAHKLSVKKPVYEAVFQGDEVYMEFAPVSGTLLLLKKQGSVVSLS